MDNGKPHKINSVQRINDINDLDMLREIARTAKRIVIHTENSKAVHGTIYATINTTQRDFAIDRLQNLLQGLI